MDAQRPDWGSRRPHRVWFHQRARKVLSDPFSRKRKREESEVLKTSSWFYSVAMRTEPPLDECFSTDFGEPWTVTEPPELALPLMLVSAKARTVALLEACTVPVRHLRSRPSRVAPDEALAVTCPQVQDTRSVAPLLAPMVRAPDETP